jgi:tetratricopeptide (TPR) repeat protein
MRKRMRMLLIAASGLILVGALWTTGYAKEEVSSSNSSAVSHYRDGWLNYFNFPIDGPRWEQAVQEFQKAIEIEPGNVTYRLSLAVAFEKLGKGSEAVKQYQEAVRLSPQDAYLYFVLGRFYSKDKNTKTDAVTEIKKAIQIKSDEALFHYYLAHILFSTAGDYDSQGKFSVTDGKAAQEAFKETEEANKQPFVQYLLPYPKDYISKLEYMKIIALWSEDDLPELTIMGNLSRENITLAEFYEKQKDDKKATQVYQATIVMGKKLAEQEPLAMMKLLSGIAIDSRVLKSLEKNYSARNMPEELKQVLNAEAGLKEIQDSCRKEVSDINKHATPFWSSEENELRQQNKEEIFFLEAPFIRNMLQKWSVINLP